MAENARRQAITSPSWDLPAWIEGYLGDLDASRPSPHTLVLYRRELATWATWADGEGYAGLDALGLRAATRYVARLGARSNGRGGRLSANSIRDYVAVLSAFASWLVEQDALDANPWSRVRRPKPDVRRRRWLSDDEVKRLRSVCARDRSVMGLRDYALVAVLLDTGLRIAEATALDTADVTPAGTLTVMGKGRKERRAVLSRGTRRAVWAYVKARAPMGDEGSGALWWGRGGRLSTSAAKEVIRRRCEAAGLGSVYPHTLRRTAAVGMLRAGMDLLSVRDVLGHSSVKQTEQYLHMTDADVTTAHRRASHMERLGW